MMRTVKTARWHDQKHRTRMGGSHVLTDMYRRQKDAGERQGGRRGEEGRPASQAPDYGADRGRAGAGQPGRTSAVSRQINPLDATISSTLNVSVFGANLSELPYMFPDLRWTIPVRTVSTILSADSSAAWVDPPQPPMWTAL